MDQLQRSTIFNSITTANICISFLHFAFHACSSLCGVLSLCGRYLDNMSTTNNQIEGNASTLKKDCEVKQAVEPPPLEVEVPLARNKLALAGKATSAEVPQTTSRRSSDCSDLSTEQVDDPTFDVTIETQFPNYCKSANQTN